MKLKTIYDIAIKNALKADLRPKSVIDKKLKEVKKEYRKAKGVDKTAFDKEALKHPYFDSRILNGRGDEEVKNVMVGVDIGVSELLLADRLRERGEKVDLVISHHPSGRALAQLHKVMGIQSGVWEKYGLTKEVAEGIMKDRIGEVSRGLSPINHTRAADAAKLLGIPFMCLHTAADNCAANYLQKLFDKRSPKKLKNILTLLKGLPEYKYAVKDNAGPFILIGEDSKDAGKIFVDMTGGTSGPEKMFSRLSQAGVNTIVGMHCKETSFKVAQAEFINYVIAGHISSDNLGMNLMFDAIEKKGKLNFIEVSGFRRVRRK